MLREIGSVINLYINKFQSANHILMIEPYEFYSNNQTQASNHYQNPIGTAITNKEITKKAIKEFNNLKNKIIDKGIKVTSFKGIKGCPDHVFPNWLATFEDKTMQLFPMMAPNRRLEKTPYMVNALSKEYKLTADLSSYESKNVFLESTSSIVFDRINKRAFIGFSPRTNKELATKWCKQNNFQMVGFETKSHTGEPIYHTDVFMFIGTKMLGICMDIIEPKFKAGVEKEILKYHEVMHIEKNQLLDFCGNAIELRNKNNEPFIIMSSRAKKALTQTQVDLLLRHYKEIIHADLSTIENFGGGSARCMITELM